MLKSIRLSKNNYVNLDTYSRHEYKPNSMQFHHYLLSILCGIGLGILGTIAGQKEINKHTASHCYGPADQIVPIRSFIGTVNYCVKGGNIK